MSESSSSVWSSAWTAEQIDAWERLNAEYQRESTNHRPTPGSTKARVEAARRAAQNPGSTSTTRRRDHDLSTQAARERLEEAEALDRYEAAPQHVRDWIHAHVAARIAGKKVPALWADFTLRAVLVDWKHDRLSEDPYRPQVDDDEAMSA